MSDPLLPSGTLRSNVTDDEVLEADIRARAARPVRTFGETCCCVSIRRRDDVAQWMLLDEHTEDPSLLSRCLCNCAPAPRLPGGIEKEPRIAAFAGVTVQKAPPDWPTQGSLQGLKFTPFDPVTRVAEKQVFGGFGGLPDTGTWTEPASDCKWYVLMSLARCGNYTYSFEFDEDFRRADIKIKLNPCFLCTCVPCVPAWCTVPDSLAKFDMVQADDSTDGSEWIRRSSSGGKPLKESYRLRVVYNPDGTPGRFHGDLVEAPEQMIVSR